MTDTASNIKQAPLRPLQGLRVLDISQGVAGPYAAALLAQYGAQVIKVEPPGGDWSRAVGNAPGQQSALSATYNQAKRSLVLDLKQPDGLTILNKLASSADVFIESGRPGVADRLGIGQAVLCARHPKLIYLSVSGFGQTGPLAARPCTDTVAQAFSGLMSNNIAADGTPQKIDVLVVDVVTGLYGFQAITMALMQRGISGEGRYLDHSLISSIAEVQAARMVDYHLCGGPPPTLVSPSGAFKAADGYIVLAALNQKHYELICHAIDAPQLISDSRFADKDLRVQNRDAIRVALEQVLSQHNCDYWLEKLAQAQVLADRLNDLGDYMHHPHIEATRAVRMDEQPGLGRIPRPGVPGFGIDQKPMGQCPALGEHSEEILSELGYDTGAITAFRDNGVTAKAS